MMVLVDYSDSESGPDSDVPGSARVSEEEIQPQQQASSKRKRDAQDEGASQRPSPLPPLPPSFHSLYASTVRTSTADDPDLHGGRKRQVPHVEGNWPTHVYLEWYPPKAELRVLEDLISKARNASTIEAANKSATIHSFLHSSLGAQLPLHISLSAPLVLQTHQKADFDDRFQNAVRETAIHSFVTSPTGLGWKTNHDCSRSFLVLTLSQPVQDELNRLLHASNKCAASLGLPLLYDEQRGGGDFLSKASTKRSLSRKDHSSAFHISIAWRLGEVSEEERAEIAKLDTSEITGMKINFDTLKIKVGNVVRHMPLRQ